MTVVPFMILARIVSEVVLFELSANLAMVVLLVDVTS